MKSMYSTLEYFGNAVYDGRVVRRVYLTGCTKALVVALQVTDSFEGNRNKCMRTWRVSACHEARIR